MIKKEEREREREEEAFGNLIWFAKVVGKKVFDRIHLDPEGVKILE